MLRTVATRKMPSVVSAEGSEGFRLAGISVGGFLDQLGSEQPAPGGGAAGAVAAALAASLVAMTARLSTAYLPDLDAVATRMDSLRRDLLDLAGLDVDAYTAVISAHRLPDEPGSDVRRRAIREALRGASLVPLAVAETCTEVIAAGELLARAGNPNLRGDARTAILLADAAANAAADLVRINVTAGDLEVDLDRRATHAAAVTRSVAQLPP